MKVDTIMEHDDGSATVMISEITPFELEALVTAGFVALLEKHAKEVEEKKKVPAILKGDGK